jgi:hypothetical protein
VKNSKKRILLPPAAKQLKSLAEFHAAHGANEFDRFLPRRVRGKKHFARSECTRLRRVRRAECDPTQKRQPIRLPFLKIFYLSSRK